MKNIELRATDGYLLSLHVYECENPIGVVQVVHGMCEHQDRYKRIAELLSSNGYVVVLNDLRGHGKNAPLLGYFSKKDGFKKLIQDQRDITFYIRKEYPNLPVSIFAHSMGTIITRLLLKSNSKDYYKVVLCGFPNYLGAAKAGIAVCNILSVFRGEKHRSNMLKKMVFGSYVKSVEGRKSDFDWLSVNEDNVHEYTGDDLCGYTFTVSAYRDLFKMVSLLKSSKYFFNINKELKLLLISGENDPCTGGNKGRTHSRKILTEAGFTDIEEKIYIGLRHEILNEEGKEAIVNDILAFYNKK